MDDFCCRRQWDSGCVSKAIDNLDECPNDFPPQVNSCFEVDPFLRSGCDDPVCEESVCSEDPDCCSGPYDRGCADIALKECPLPQPENHCFEASPLPGCDNPDDPEGQCLEMICEENNDCCTNRYSQACIGIARTLGGICFPPDDGNTCFQSSPYGGCDDPRCANLVCDFLAGCCDGDEIGEWSDLCISVAEDFCQPEVIPRPGGDCPVGFTCDEISMANCTGLRTTAVEQFEIGTSLVELVSCC